MRSRRKGDVKERRRVRCARRDHDRIFHRAVFGEGVDNAGRWWDAFWPMAT